MNDGVAFLRSELIGQLDRAAAAAGYARSGSIPADMTFIQWCEDLASKGLKVDGHPWTLDDRPSMRPLYEAIPSSIAEARRRTLVLRKGAQLGATLWECLADLYMAIKFEPCVIGLYLPDQATAADKSQRRFLRIIRTIPSVYRRLTTRYAADDSIVNVGEGNVLTRVFGESAFLFLWTSSKTATESRPADILSYDEVQEMTLEEVDRVYERLSASRIRFRLMLSTPNTPDGDIDYYYKLGTQQAFHTECPHCMVESDLSVRWPSCCVYNTGQVKGAPVNEWAYVCPECAGWIEDTQRGRFIANNPSSSIESFHLSQIQSPTITARDMAEAWNRSVTGDQRKTFYCRKLGIPYIDQEQLPVDMAACLACMEEGIALGLTWQTGGRDTFMGIDQMGSFSVAIIKRRLPDNRQAVVHVEAIYSSDPFKRCDELMDDFGVQVCVIEQLPNVNDARRFANRHRGKVFLAGYSAPQADMIVWGDVANRSDRKTVEEDRTRYTVQLQQYKAMQAALFRVKNRHCLFPDSALLTQTVIERGLRKQAQPLRDMVFFHFTKTALVVDQDDETRTPKPRVVKVGGVDPHFSFANMLCDVAWSRIHGAASFIMPQGDPLRERPNTPLAQRVDEAMPGLPREVIGMLDDQPEATCGSCNEFDAAGNRCKLRGLLTTAKEASCPLYDPVPRPQR